MGVENKHIDLIKKAHKKKSWVRNSINNVVL
jgi:hypothetical protein